MPDAAAAVAEAHAEAAAEEAAEAAAGGGVVAWPLTAPTVTASVITAETVLHC